MKSVRTSNGSSAFEACSSLTGEVPDMPCGYDRFNSSIAELGSMFANCTGLSGGLPKMRSDIALGDPLVYAVDNDRH